MIRIGAFWRYAPESGLFKLTLSFVGPDPGGGAAFGRQPRALLSYRLVQSLGSEADRI
jgi:hypothetical protein